MPAALLAMNEPTIIPLLNKIKQKKEKKTELEKEEKQDRNIEQTTEAKVNIKTRTIEKERLRPRNPKTE